MTSPLDTRAGDAVRLRLPRPPEPPPRHPFPLLASLAPVVGSVVIWAITSSPFALVFALLGPIIAVASFADARMQGRRSSRRERERFAEELAELRAAVHREHERERERLHRRSPGPAALLAARERDPERWHGALDRSVPVVIGYGEILSAVHLDGDGGGAPAPHDVEVAALREQAATVDGVPVVVDARLGIGVCGAPGLAAAVARGVILQLAGLLPPEGATVAATPGLALADEEWMALLPHVRLASSSVPDSSVPDAVVFASAIDATTRGRNVGTAPAGSAEAVVAVARHAHELPHRCRIVLRVGGGAGAAIIAHPEPEFLASVGVVYLSEEQAADTAELLARAARSRRGVVGELPDLLAFGALPVAEPDPERSRSSLSAAFLGLETGEQLVDLVRDGPHAVVGGMTGSGKSELLLSWLLAMAAAYPPNLVNFLLVDFKGGSAFAPIMGLSHVVGLVTDLDDRSARRALHSLRAEVRHRERMLADAGARSIEALPPSVDLARLVIVVDEFAALVGDFVELHELFADLAARGRSLGIHLILCTQRPAGVVRDSVLANVPLRLSLRVNNGADSAAVVGTDAAAALPADPAGRAVLAMAGGDPVTVQVAIVELGDIARVAQRWADAPAVRRPWCPELPALVTVDDLRRRYRESDRGGVVSPAYPFGLVDLPDQQRQDPALWSPRVDGSLLVLGGGGSGKSELLATLCTESAGEVVPPLPEEAWDAVAATVDELRRGRARPGVLLLDDLDVLVTRFGDEHRDAFGEMLQEILRTGGSAGVSVVLAARRLSGGLQSVVAGCESRVILRQSDRQEHLLAGARPELFRPDAPPGRGEWRGAELQVAVSPAIRGGAESSEAVSSEAVSSEAVSFRSSLAMSSTLSLDSDISALIVVTGRPAEITRRFARAIDLSRSTTGAIQLDGEEPRVWVGDPQSWQARWSQLALLRGSVPVLIDRCSLTELRAVLGQRVLPPPLDTSRETAWLLQPDGQLRRVVIPSQIE